MAPAAGPAAPVIATAHSARFRTTWLVPSGAADRPKHRHGARTPRLTATWVPAAKAASNPAASSMPARTVVGATIATAMAASAAATVIAAARLARAPARRMPGIGKPASHEANSRKEAPLRILLKADTANVAPIRKRQARTT